MLVHCAAVFLLGVVFVQSQNGFSNFFVENPLLSKNISTESAEMIAYYFLNRVKPQNQKSGVCLHPNLYCIVPLPSAALYGFFECSNDYQCPGTVKCCRNACFLTKVCQNAADFPPPRLIITTATQSTFTDNKDSTFREEISRNTILPPTRDIRTSSQTPKIKQEIQVYGSVSRKCPDDCEDEEDYEFDYSDRATSNSTTETPKRSGTGISSETPEIKHDIQVYRSGSRKCPDDCNDEEDYEFDYSDRVTTSNSRSETPSPTDTKTSSETPEIKHEIPVYGSGSGEKPYGDDEDYDFGVSSGSGSTRKTVTPTTNVPPSGTKTSFETPEINYEIPVYGSELGETPDGYDDDEDFEFDYSDWVMNNSRSETPSPSGTKTSSETPEIKLEIPVYGSGSGGNPYGDDEDYDFGVSSGFGSTRKTVTVTTNIPETPSQTRTSFETPQITNELPVYGSGSKESPYYDHEDEDFEFDYSDWVMNNSRAETPIPSGTKTSSETPEINYEIPVYGSGSGETPDEYDDEDFEFDYTDWVTKNPRTETPTSSGTRTSSEFPEIEHEITIYGSASGESPYGDDEDYDFGVSPGSGNTPKIVIPTSSIEPTPTDTRTYSETPEISTEVPVDGSGSTQSPDDYYDDDFVFDNINVVMNNSRAEISTLSDIGTTSDTPQIKYEFSVYGISGPEESVYSDNEDYEFDYSDWVQNNSKAETPTTVISPATSDIRTSSETSEIEREIPVYGSGSGESPDDYDGDEEIPGIRPFNNQDYVVD